MRDEHFHFPRGNLFAWTALYNASLSDKKDVKRDESARVSCGWSA